MSEFTDEVTSGIPAILPDMPPTEEGISHAPSRPQVLVAREREQALANALRYFPESMHSQLAGEFADELATDGRIYMRRFRPHSEIKARAIDEYPARCPQAAAIMLMIQNNLDRAVAQHPTSSSRTAATAPFFRTGPSTG